MPVVYWLKLKDYTDPLKQGYIGVSVNKDKRLSEHFNKLSSNKHENPVVQRYYNKYKSDIEVQILLEGSETDCYIKELSLRPVEHIGWNIAPGVCYEECHAGLCRTLHAQGADLLLFLNNDGWYDTSSLTHHHAAHGQLRAIELGCPVLQVGHTGMTGGWDCYGQLLGQYPLYERGVLSLEVTPVTHSTPWSQWGYGTWGLFGMVTVLGWLSQLRAGRASLDPARRLEQIPSG